MTTYTVDTDGTSGTYSGIAAAVAALPNPLTDDYTIELSATTSVADTLAATLQLGIDTELAYRLTVIQVDANYLMEIPAAYEVAIQGNFSVVNNVTLKDIKFEKTSMAADLQRLLTCIDPRDGDVIIDGCDFKCFNTATYRTRGVYLQPRFTGSTSEIYFQNNRIWNINSGSAHATNAAFYAETATTQAVYIYNNTVVGGTNLFYAISTVANWIFVNNIVDVETAIGETVSASSDYNSFSVAEDTGGTNDRQSQTFGFDDASNGDFHLTSGDDGATGYGVGPSTDATVPVLDADDVTRAGTICDIGAYEYVAGGEPSGVVIFRRRMEESR